MGASNVTAAKPKVGGAVYVAPTGTALPTSTAAALNSAFKPLGYISEDGLTNSNSPESESVKAWGGDTVLTLMTGREDTFSFSLIEAMSDDVLKLVYGDSKVSGSLVAGLTVNVGADDLQDHAYVIDMVLRDNTAKRIVIPIGRVSELGEITYSDSAAVGYDITISAAADSSGYTHYEYIKAASSGTS